jgi:hypothetical protein
MQIFNSNVDEQRGVEFLKRGKLLKEHLDKNSVIDPIGATEYECKYCSYFDYCQKDGFKEIAPPKLNTQVAEKPKQKIEKPLVPKKTKKKFEYKEPKEGFLI